MRDHSATLTVRHLFSLRENSGFMNAVENSANVVRNKKISVVFHRCTFLKATSSRTPSLRSGVHSSVAERSKWFYAPYWSPVKGESPANGDTTSERWLDVCTKISVLPIFYIFFSKYLLRTRLAFELKWYRL